jgi:NADH-quinone oxidoreductase subunit L
MIPYQFIWLIFLLPFFSFLIIAFFIRPFVKQESRIAGYTLIAALSISLALSVWTLASVMTAPNHELPVPVINWVVIEGGVTLHLGLLVDALTAVMLVVVTFVSLMIQIYSQGYMRGDPGYHRYYAWMSLFTMSMLGLIVAGNLVFMFVFWELVGLCSYLLIGFWFHKPSAADAAKKAFIVTRVGDFGFLVGILILYLNTGTFDIAELHELAITGVLAGSVLTWGAIGIFAGAVGKSAQFPLHTWLPDAMEGPTPVSALIHSATMVSAGVFLVARMFPLFENSAEALTTVAIIGGVTAIFAASMGLVANDIKRVLAYSTISQLGYMMLGLGTGGVAIGIFHLFNHAFFKALLFLGAGSVNHATGTFDMRLMGGLRRMMPWTYATFVIASLSIAGIWPLSGFWSKDEIVISALAQPVLFVLAMITVFMTAFYMFRAVFMTFGGEYRGGGPETHDSHPHESPNVMVIPMVALAVLAVFSGLWNVTGHFGALLGQVETHGFFAGLFHPFTQVLPWLSLILAGLGILLAYAMYDKKWVSAERLGRLFRPLYSLFLHKYWLDELYENVIVKTVLLRGLFGGFERFDSRGVDGVVNGVASGAIYGGRALRRMQTGQLQLYGLFMGIGVLALIFTIFFFG